MGRNWPAQDPARLAVYDENREWGAELDPWQLPTVSGQIQWRPATRSVGAGG
jgi:hypothetical protein